jgi:membrane associated rhomboid family serine protease
MVVIYLASPEITPATYTLLAPWMHAGFRHISQNLLVFVPRSTWIEHRVGWRTYLFFAVMIPYLVLYIPVVAGYGGLSRGASGLTMTLTGFAIPILLVGLADRANSFDRFNWRASIIWLVIFLMAAYLTMDAWLTVERFIGLEPRPDGVSVSSHATGLLLGILWFAWRAWRHGLWDA